MMNGVTLSEVIDKLDGLDDDDTIYAEAPMASARAVVAREPEDGSLPPEAAGLCYLLEVNLAREAVRVWSERCGGVTPARDEKLAAVVHYAVYDAFLPTE